MEWSLCEDSNRCTICPLVTNTGSSSGSIRGGEGATGAAVLLMRMTQKIFFGEQEKEVGQINSSASMLAASLRQFSEAKAPTPVNENKNIV